MYYVPKCRHVLVFEFWVIALVEANCPRCISRVEPIHLWDAGHGLVDHLLAVEVRQIGVELVVEYFAEEVVLEIIFRVDPLCHF